MNRQRRSFCRRWFSRACHTVSYYLTPQRFTSYKLGKLLTWRTIKPLPSLPESLSFPIQSDVIGKFTDPGPIETRKQSYIVMHSQKQPHPGRGEATPYPTDEGSSGALRGQVANIHFGIQGKLLTEKSQRLIKPAHGMDVIQRKEGMRVGD